MAGGKETPRQKMISLMYLVLLAMLALQVSSVIIGKFQQLNESLESSIHASQERNNEQLEQIKTAVENNKFAPEDVKVQKDAETVRGNTTQLLAFIKSIKDELIQRTGGKDELGNYNGAKEEEPVSNYMLGAGDSKSGKGYDLKKKLDTYLSGLIKIAEANKVHIDETSLAMDGKENPMFKNNPEQRRKDFAHLNFEGAPLVAALAVMSERANKIMSLEAELLSGLAAKVGAKNIPVDQVRPVVKATAQKVVAGTKYEAEFFMAAYSSSYKPEMTYNQQALEVNNEGIGKVEFKASGGNYDADGLMKKTWTGTIKYPKAGGGDSLYTITQEYYVVKPAIQVSSAANFALYKDCGNELTFQVPALGADYNPTITATGAKVRTTATRGQVVIIPHSPNVTVSIKNDGVNIGSESFKVKLMPKPDVIVKCKDRLVDPVKGVKPADLRKVEVIPVADKAFKQSNPRDSQFKTVRWKASLVRNGRIKGTPKIIERGVGNLRRFEARSGDRIIIEEIKIKRRNFENRVVDVDVGKPVFIIPIQEN